MKNLTSVPALATCLLLSLAGLPQGIAQPRITQQPASQSLSLGATATFRVTATTTNGPMTYQWRHNDLDIMGATNLSLSLTNLQTTNAGPYFVIVTDMNGSTNSAAAVLDVDPTFTRITSDPIVTDQGYNNIAGYWADLDNDGDLDLFVVTDRAGYNPTYRNDGDGTFTRTFEPSLQAVRASGWTYSWGDYDNDGYLDLFVPELYANIATLNQLYHNNGDGTFTNITNSPIARGGGFSAFGTWGDYDRDGDLDLFVANRGHGTVPSKNWFYQNQGDGTFVSLTNDLIRPLISELQCWNLPVWVDIDNDGWQDLFIANIPDSRNCLYRNMGNGGFIKVTGDPLVSELNNWGDAGWADYDNDGDLDVFLTTISDYARPAALYRNDGQGHFTKMTTNEVGTLLSERVNSFQCAWGDYDNDGWLDLHIANGWYGGDARPDLLYRNHGDGSFTKVTTGSPANEKGAALGSFWVDINNDGFLDLYTATSSPAPDNSLSRLYRNNGNSNSWLCVKCEGTVSPRWGTGTKVRVKATIRGTAMWQLRVIEPGGWSNGQNYIAHFGLGDATNVAVLRIEWTSGIVQEIQNVPVRQYLTVTEPPMLRMSRAGELQVQCWQGMVHRIERSSDLLNWTPLATMTNLNLTGGVLWRDPEPTGAQGFYRVRRW